MAVQGHEAAARLIMRVAFRTDASLQIGTGHVMRCLTLADALTAKGAECHFLCRAHPGNLIELIGGKGHALHELPTSSMGDMDTGLSCQQASVTTHAGWLGTSQASDAEACAPILTSLRPDWLVVDHYALDAAWERLLAPYCARLMVIDDLADRPHTCDLLLDQTFGRNEADYRPLVPTHCRILCGTDYALLRPEFAELRPYSLQRRSPPALRELLVSLGGVDSSNVTGQVLRALRSAPLADDCRITVVMGATAPWLAAVRSDATELPWSTRVLVGSTDMAQLMADSDLAIGAAGVTAWERCCLGLPSITLILASNQITIAHSLSSAGAICLATKAESDINPLLSNLQRTPGAMTKMSAAGTAVCDGLGTSRVVRQIEGM